MNVNQLQNNPRWQQNSIGKYTLDLQFLDDKVKDQFKIKNSVNLVPKTEQQRKIQREYNRFFEEVQHDIRKSKIQQIPEETLKIHKIKVITNQKNRTQYKLIDQGLSYFQLCNSNHGGIQCHYNVIIGKFFLTVNVLHLHRNSLIKENNCQLLGQGSFGIVSRLKIGNKQIAIKKIKFSRKKQYANLDSIVNLNDYANSTQIKRSISQYCLFKICSMLKVGPQVIFQNCYDLVCYNDCVQFQMEYCQKIGQNIDIKSFQKDIKRCLGILHSMKIIHKDVKKQNILYSPSFKSYVLSDFGLTHSVKQNIWQRTETYFAGTISCVSEEMMKLLTSKSGPGLVNLYMNDIHGLKEVLEQLKCFVKNEGKDFSKNQLSDDRYENGDSQCDCQYEDAEIIEDQCLSYIKSNSTNITSSNDTLAKSQISCQRLNYYMIKALYNYLRNQLKQQKKQQVQTLKTTICQLIKNEPQSQLLKLSLIDLITPIITILTDKQQSSLFNIRNLIRMYGLHSQQLFIQLKDVNMKKNIPCINQTQLDKYLAFNQNRNKIEDRKFNHYLMNLNRHFCLRNYISLIMSFRTLMKDYLNQKQTNQEKRQLILKVVLEKMQIEGLTEDEVIEITMLLSNVYKRSNQKVNSQNYQKFFLNLFDNIYIQLERKNQINSLMLFNLVRHHQFMKSHKKAEYYKKILIERKEKLQQYLKNNNLENKEREQIEYKILKYQIKMHGLLMSSNESAKILQSCKNLYRKITENQIRDQQLRILILDNYTTCLCREKLFDQAQQICNELQKQIIQFIFPKKVSIQYSLFENYKGIIQLGKNNYQKALKHFQLILDLTNDPLRGNHYISLIKQAFLNISKIFSCQGNLQLSLQYLIKALQISISYDFCQTQQTIQIIMKIIKMLLLMNKCDSQLVLYFDKLAYYRNLLINLKSNRVVFKPQSKKKMPLYMFSQIQSMSQQTQRFAKKLCLTIIQPYLPMYQDQYKTFNRQLQQYYWRLNMNSKAIMFRWNLLKRSSRDPKFFQILIIFINKLISINSSRRAYMHLNKLIFHYPNSNVQQKEKIIEKLYELSFDLNSKNKALYIFIRKMKIYQSQLNLKQATLKIPEHVNNRFAQRIWEKKIKMFHSASQSQVNTQQNLSQIKQQQTDQQTLNLRLKQKGLKISVFLSKSK